MIFNGREDLRTQGKELILNWYDKEDCMYAFIRDIGDTNNHFCLASFNAITNIHGTGKILTELGYAIGQPYIVQASDIENEVKVELKEMERVNSLREQLNQEGTLCSHVEERNTLLDKNKELRESGRLLRIREEKEIDYPFSLIKTELTYKGSKQKGKFKKKLEVNVGIKNGPMAVQFFQQLRYVESNVYIKERATYDFNDVKVFLDRAMRYQIILDFNFRWRNFIEIEGSDEGIEDTLKKLHLDDLPHAGSYGKIL